MLFVFLFCEGVWGKVNGKLCCHGGLCARVLRECMAVVVPKKR